MSEDELSWSCLDSNQDYNYTQFWDNKSFKLVSHKKWVHCYINDKEIFKFSKGARVVTDLNGKILRLIGVDIQPTLFKLSIKNKSIIKPLLPNEIYEFSNSNEFILIEKHDFYL